MLKHLLLASIAFVSTQEAFSSCPPCDSNNGGVTGWVLLPVGKNGAPCHSSGAEEGDKSTHEHLPSTHTHNAPSTPSHESKSSEEELITKLKAIKPHLYYRANPHHPTQEKRGEWGKALADKVYFKVLGEWVHDPSVNATTDIIETGVQAKKRALEAAMKKQQSSSEVSSPSESHNAPEAKPTSNKNRKKWPTVSPAHALGTTARPNTVKTEDNTRNFSQGSANVAQTGVTGTTPTPADTSATGPAIPPPPPLPATQP